MLGPIREATAQQRARMSPYVLQHADNPVDWWPWCDEAFEQARQRDVPVLVSIGYAACHWCHVMAHESFEDPQTAAVMNANFVNIKVDREERPDIDAAYMAATTALTGHGGWPMTVFVDHRRRPFYAGTYFPPHPRQGMPSFAMVLSAVTQAWQQRRGAIEQQAELISDRLARSVGPAKPLAGVPEQALGLLRASFDAQWGGFGRAPKFPQPMVHEFLLRHYARTGDTDALAMAETTLSAMAAGGMYDQLGGGFCRYSVDGRWLIPHFEKMLYDNALLMRVYLHWWRETDSALAREVVCQTAQFLLTELLTDQGCFAASLDADSQGREGAFYVWTPEQIRAAGGDPQTLGVTESGTFEDGASVIVRTDQPWPREALLSVREQRERPARDDKVVLAWNAWAVQALAEAGALLGEPAWVDAAMRCRDALWEIHVDGEQVYRVSRDGLAGAAVAVLEDLAALALAEFTLACVVGGDAARGVDLVRRIEREFVVQQRDTTAHDLPHVGVDMSDNATPSGWSLAAEALLVAAAWTGGDHEAALEVLGTAAGLAEHPQFWGHGLSVLEAALDGPVEVAVIDAAALHDVALRTTRPGAVIALDGPLTQGRAPGAAYVCRGFVCEAPTSDPEVLARQLRVRPTS